VQYCCGFAMASLCLFVLCCSLMCEKCIGTCARVVLWLDLVLKGMLVLLTACGIVVLHSMQMFCTACSVQPALFMLVVWIL
jgi:hypothetical protein